jgi:hypothetical protein
MRLRLALVALLVGATALAPSAVVGNELGDTATKPQVALDWNSFAVDAVRAAKTMDGVAPGLTARFLYQTEGLVYMSYVQAAVYDAAMKIEPRYELYHSFKAKAGHASLEAAVIAAAYNTLVFYLGDPSGVLAAKYAASIGALPADRKTARGIAVGEAAAADIENLRATDGRNAPVSDVCTTPTVPPTPGVWLCAPPPSLQVEQTPWVGSMQPFMLESASRFRAPAPPELTSTLYATELDETRTLGEKNSTVRTPDQTKTALFWNANAINQLSQTLRDAATQHHMDLVDTVRLLAMGEMIPTDAGIACFDSKYHYRFWRPITAIRNDGNPADLTWSPQVTTPNHPEYPSQHGCVTSALADVIAEAIGADNIDLTVWGAQGGATSLSITRTYSTVHDLDTELVDARVWMGFHYRNSVVVGERLGGAVAGWELDRFFQSSEDGGNHEGGGNQGD